MPVPEIVERRVEEAGHLGVGPVCGSHEGHLAGALLGETLGASIGHPDLYGTKALRSEGIPVLPYPFAYGSARHGDAPDAYPHCYM